MNSMVKIFCRGEEQKSVGERYHVIEQYAGFVIAEVSQMDLKEISQKYPVDDITDLYKLHVGERVIDTSMPRIEAKGKVRSHPAYKGTKQLSPGRHHYLVQCYRTYKGRMAEEDKGCRG